MTLVRRRSVRVLFCDVSNRENRKYLSERERESPGKKWEMEGQTGNVEVRQTEERVG